jgi:F-type H+-transporting ATPase subunit epsilon
MSNIYVDVVSAEKSIFSGEAKFVALPGESGELGILHGHTPLITRIRPGSVRIEKADGDEEFVLQSYANRLSTNLYRFGKWPSRFMQ